MRFNQITLASSNYNHPTFANTIKTLHDIYPHINLNTFDVVKYTKPTDQETEENEFIFRLMSRRNNS